MVKVAFQGEKGAFSEDAVFTFFSDADTFHYRYLSDVFEAILMDEVDFGVVPVENSQAGSINETYDLLLSYPLNIFGEINLRINHCLVALPGETLDELKIVYSHPQALAQCQEFLGKLNVEIIPGYNTAGSAKMIKEEGIKGRAAVASRRAAQIYGLEILSVDLPDLTFEVICSGGTYIRSLAADLGLRLGPGAHLRALRRLSSGPFQVEDAIDSGMLTGPWPDDLFQTAMKPLAEALPQMRTVAIDGAMAEKVKNGHQPQWKELARGLNGSEPPSGLMKLTHEEALIAILSFDRSQGDRSVSVKIMRVFT